MSESERIIMQNQIEIMCAISLLLRYARPDLAERDGELRRQRDDLFDRYKTTRTFLASEPQP